MHFIANRAGFKLRFHDLRHTHATLMLKSGIHPKIVSERLGHATVAFTLDTYTHVVPGIQEASEKLGISDSHCRRLLETGKIKGIKLGHDWVVRDLKYKRKRKPKEGKS